MGITLRDSNEKIDRDIRIAAVKQLEDQYYKHVNLYRVENIVRTFVIEAIRKSPTWRSLNKGEDNLDAHLGIPKNELSSRLNTLLDIWSKEIKVIAQPPKQLGHSFHMTYTFGAIQADWANVLNSTAGIVINRSSRSRTGAARPIIPWLEWLLIGGDQFIDDFEIRLEEGAFPQSRSGDAIMIKVDGSQWRLPPKFGPYSPDNNFVTQALFGLTKNPAFKQAMIKAFSTVFKSPVGALAGRKISVDISQVLDALDF